MTADQLQFMARFSRSPDWAQLSKILEGMEAEILERLLNVHGDLVYRAQGELRMLHRLRQEVITASATLDRNAALRMQSAAARKTGSHAGL